MLAIRSVTHGVPAVLLRLLGQLPGRAASQTGLLQVNWAALPNCSSISNGSCSSSSSVSSSASSLRSFSSSPATTLEAGDSPGTLRVCVVGTGPAGFYTASQLLKRFGERVRVDLLDRLPTPFGLVRSGVAPDHPDVKNVNNQFTAVGKDPRCSFFGNVTLGRDVQLQELRAMYNAVVLAYGAESDRKLGIPGEDAGNVFAAREFVWWYNAHPDARKLPIDLSHVENVAVCGIGNVALDCARVLLRGAAGLGASDVAAHALEALRGAAGRVKNVQLLVRRGPVQAACSAKELKELVSEPDVWVHAPEPQMSVSAADKAVMKTTRQKRRIYDIIKQAAADAKAGSRHLHFQFYRSPVEIVVDESSGRVKGVRVEVTALKEGPGESVAVGTGVFETLPAELVLISIGYKSLPVPGLPFDQRRGVVPNEAGRVLSPGTKPGAGADGAKAGYEAGLYVCGWLKRGPTGIVGTNLTDAEETVGSVVEDEKAGLLGGGGEEKGGQALAALLAGRGVRSVSFEEWLVLDEAERGRGEKEGRLRSKIAAVEEMLQVLDEEKDRQRP